MSRSFNTPPTNPDTGSQQYIDHFNSAETHQLSTVFEANFPASTLNTDFWIETTANGGSVTVADGVGKPSTSTASNGSAKLRSVDIGAFNAGKTSVFQTGTYVGTGVANNTRIWGLMSADEQNGLYFKLDGTTFQVVAKKGGTETTVDQSSFNGLQTISPIAGNRTWYIHYSAGQALFEVQSGNKTRLLHKMTRSDLPLVNTLDLYAYYENTNTGNTSDVEMRIRGSSISICGNPDSIRPMNVTRDVNSETILQPTASVLIGQDTSNTYRNTQVNKAGAVLTSDFGTEVARGLYSGFSIGTKFGRNPDIDTGSTPEDMWNGASIYTGFNATGNENIEVFSSDNDDRGSLVSSGTATGGSATTLIDTGATFSTDGVAVGDIVLNDTQGVHGIITAVDSETQVTVFRMNDGGTSPANASGDTYRIANANDTGAAVIKLKSLLDEDYVEQTDAYVIMNGTTGVTLTGDYMRCPRASVILAGSSEINEGAITIRQASTTANVFAVMPTFGQTTIGALTVPAGKIMVIKRLRVSITRTNGSAGSATIVFNTRPFGQAWNGKRVFELNTAAATEFTAEGGITLLPGTDMKYTITDVSDNNTVAEGAFEYYLIDE